MRSPFSPESSTTIGAIGWARAMPPRAASAGATMSREPSSRAATQTPDPSYAFRQPKIEKQVFDAVKCALGSNRLIDGLGARSPVDPSADAAGAPPTAGGPI
jgi:hypothetical protein